MVKITMALLQR